MPAPCRERAKAEIDLSGPAGIIELDGQDVAGIRIAVRPMPFIQATGGELSDGAVRVRPGLDLWFVKVPAEDEVGPRSDVAPEVSAVPELVEGVVHQDDPEAGKRCPVLVGGQLSELGVRQPQLPSVVVISAEPCGIETDEMHGHADVWQENLAAVSEKAVGRLRRIEIRPAEAVPHPGTIGCLPLQEALPPVVLKAHGAFAAGHPAGKVQRIGRVRRLADGGPDILMNVPSDVMVAGDGEEAVFAEVEAGEEAFEEVGGLGVFLREAPVGGVAGEADEVDRTVLEEDGQILLPTIAKNATAAPGLGLPRTPLVEVGHMEDTQPVAWLGQGVV